MIFKSANTNAKQSSDRSESAEPRLTEKQVLERLFAPSEHLPEPRNGQAVVIVSPGGDERSVSHRQLENLTGHGAYLLQQRGIKADDKVVFYCENSPELIAMILACWSQNVMVALIDYRAEHANVLALSKKLGAKVLLTSKKLYTDYAREIRMYSDEKIEAIDILEIADKKDLAPDSKVDIEQIDLDRRAFTILTSGTTGAPKTSVHTLRSLVANIIDLIEAANQGTGDITALTPLPLSHIFGLTVFMISQVLSAKTVITPLEPVGFVKAVHKYKPEWIAALPQFYGALLSAPKGFINLKNSKLLLCGGAPPTVSLVDKFEETFGKQLNNGFGSTECGLVAFNNSGGPPLCVGKPAGQIKIEIVDEQNELLPEGKLGEVRIAGPMLMEGYVDNEAETKKALRNGYYYTGDLGRYLDGYLYVIGRKSDVVTVGGVVVSVGEIEESLRNHPDVKDVAITAVPNKRLGQIVKACVVLVSDKPADKLKSIHPEEQQQAQRELEREFRGYCESNLTRYQRPMKWEFWGPHESLPKTLAGKTDKKKLANGLRA